MSKARNLGNIVSGTTSTIENSVLKIKGDGSSADAKLTLNCSQNSHGVSIQAPPHSAGQSYVLILPQNTGTNGQVLATNGSGTNQLSWIDAVETKPTVANVSQTISPATATTISITGTGFTVHFKNSSNASISRNFTYQATGFGKAA